MIELSASLITNNDKKPKSIIFIFKDVTLRKQAEKDLRKAYDKLKELQSQLVQTEKMAAIGQLAGGVAHEINNPLTGVLNNAQLIKMLAAGKEKMEINEFKDLLNAIEESALRCKKITGSLLAFSRASAGTFENISVNMVINEVVSLVVHDMRLQNILLKVETQPNIPNIQGDVQLLQQIIVDMLSNAKWAVQKKIFNDSGGVIIIRSEYLLGSNYIYIYIIDNGVGIPQDVINRIFEPFFTTKDVGEGTGLGLSIAFSIIEKHRGAIEVKSKVNEGTTFKISLPVAG